MRIRMKIRRNEEGMESFDLSLMLTAEMKAELVTGLAESSFEFLFVKND